MRRRLPETPKKRGDPRVQHRIPERAVDTGAESRHPHRFSTDRAGSEEVQLRSIDREDDTRRIETYTNPQRTREVFGAQARAQEYSMIDHGTCPLRSTVNTYDNSYHFQLSSRRESTFPEHNPEYESGVYSAPTHGYRYGGSHPIAERQNNELDVHHRASFTERSHFNDAHTSSRPSRSTMHEQEDQFDAFAADYDIPYPVASAHRASVTPSQNVSAFPTDAFYNSGQRAQQRRAIPTYAQRLQEIPPPVYPPTEHFLLQHHDASHHSATRPNISARSQNESSSMDDFSREPNISARSRREPEFSMNDFSSLGTSYAKQYRKRPNTMQLYNTKPRAGSLGAHQIEFILSSEFGDSVPDVCDRVNDWLLKVHHQTGTGTSPGQISMPSPHELQYLSPTGAVSSVLSPYSPDSSPNTYDSSLHFEGRASHAVASQPHATAHVAKKKCSNCLTCGCLDCFCTT